MSVIVPTTGVRESLARCMESLCQQACSNREILVVLNGELPDTFADLVSRYSARLIHEPRLGLSRARNAGVEAAAGEIVVFTDDDTIASPDWLHRMVESFADSKVGCVSGRVEVAGKGYFRPEWTTSRRFCTSWRLDRSASDWYQQALRMDSGWGCNMAFRRSLLRECGLFPLSLGLGSAIEAGDELYMFVRILERGHALVHRPDAVNTLQFTDGAAIQRARLRRSLTGTAAFHLKLLVEENGYRTRILKKISASLAKILFLPAGEISEWSADLTVTEKLGAYFRAPLAYWKARRVESPARGVRA